MAALLVIPALAVVLAQSPAHAAGTVSVAVIGQGSATGDGISCTQSGGPDCSQFYDDTTYEDCDPERKPPCLTVTEQPHVELTAGSDANGFVYDGWTGCDGVTGRVCGLTVADDTALSVRFRDAQAPSVDGLSPSSGIRSGTLTLSASASDNAGVTRVEFRVRGVLVGADASAPYSVSFDTGTVSDGVAALQATAFDAAGHASSTHGSVTIDNSAPVVSIASGPDGDVFGPGTTQTWSFTATDTTLVSVQCSVVDAGEAHGFAACSGGNSSHSVTGQPDGDWEFAVRATDGVGRQTTVTRGFVVDATAPQVAVTSPARDSAHRPGALRWGFTATDAHSDTTRECSLVPQWADPVFGGCSGATSHTADALTGGRWTFTVRGTDASGNAATASRSVWVDALRPTITRVRPSAGSRTRDRTPLLRAVVRDELAVGIAGTIARRDVTLLLDGRARRFTLDGSRVRWQAGRLGFGRHTAKLVVSDRAGNRATRTWSFRIVR